MWGPCKSGNANKSRFVTSAQATQINLGGHNIANTDRNILFKQLQRIQSWKHYNLILGEKKYWIYRSEYNIHDISIFKLYMDRKDIVLEAIFSETMNARTFKFWL